jgi:hypothetical protein
MVARKRKEGGRRKGGKEKERERERERENIHEFS